MLRNRVSKKWCLEISVFGSDSNFKPNNSKDKRSPELDFDENSTLLEDTLNSWNNTIPPRSLIDIEKRRIWKIIFLYNIIIVEMHYFKYLIGNYINSLTKTKDLANY